MPILQLYKPTEKILERSEGCYLYDINGKEYIDLESGVWCANLGHSNKRIINVLKGQAEVSMHHGCKFRNEFSEKLSKELQKLNNFKNGSSIFLSSGSEAINLSISIAQKITGKNKILKISNSYLSAYGHGKVSPDNDYVVNANFNDIEMIQQIDFSDICAFVIETGGASIDMVRFPDDEFIYQLSERAKENSCLLIVDEVTTGMGRLGKWFGYQHYNITPDMVVTGKGLGNGYPVSALTCNQVVTKRFNGEPFRYAQSHQNDPLGCAIALEVIETIKDENLIERSAQAGSYFANALMELKKKHQDKIKDVRARGLMLATELKDNTDGNSISEILFEKGFVFTCNKNTMRFLPPFIITEEQISKFISTLDVILSQ